MSAMPSISFQLCTILYTKDPASEIGVLDNEIMFLAGNKYSFNQSHNSCALRIAAVDLEHSAKTFISEVLKNAYLKAWR